MTPFSQYEMTVNAWIVETSAEFSDGSNGEGTYPSIVRDIINLGNKSVGTANINLPTAFDGDDLEIHLMYHFTPIIIDDASIGGDEDSKGLPGVSLIASFSVIMAAAVQMTRRKSFN
jgi:hypothetical protein